MTATLQNARDHVLQQNYKSAVLAYQSILDKDDPDLSWNFSELFSFFFKAEKQQAQEEIDKLFHDSNIKLEDINTIGGLYCIPDSGINIDYAQALKWYQKALATNKDDPIAYKNIGFLYLKGYGVAKNLVTAVKYAQQAIDRVYTDKQIQTDLDDDEVLNSSEITGDELHAIGEMYHKGNDVNRDYRKAKWCYEKAIEKKSKAVVYLKLGRLYEFALGVKKDLVKAAQYYQQAIDKGCKEAQPDLNALLNSTEITGEELNSIGLMYHRGKEVKCDDTKGKSLREKALSKESKAALNRRLGMCYEYGLGRRKDLVMAAKYYQQAIDTGCIEIQSDLDYLLDSSEISGDDLNAIGEMYHTGNDIKRDYGKAKWCYENAIENASNAIVYLNLGKLYESALGVEKDLVKAIQCYQLAVDNGCIQAQPNLDLLVNSAGLSEKDLIAIAQMYHHGQKVKQNFEVARKCYQRLSDDKAKCRYLKQLERDRVLAKDKSGEILINQKDAEGNTALHRSVQGKRLKNCARLLFLGADKNVKGAADKKPFSHLPILERQKVTRLQFQLTTLIIELQKPASWVLADKLLLKGAQHGAENTRNILNDLYQIKQIKPLLDLTKLGILGLHDSSQRKKFSNEDYNSDEDDVETISANGQEFLQITIDTQNELTKNICHHAKEECENNYGIYASTNMVCVGGKRSKDNEVVATLLHELTHFIIREIFGRDQPYFQHDSTSKQLFEKIATELESKKNQLHPILQNAFSNYYKSQNAVHQELMVRIPQMIVEDNNAITTLQKQAPELFQYYQDVFLPAVNKHIEKLEKRALNDWPLDVFLEKQESPYSLRM